MGTSHANPCTALARPVAPVFVQSSHLNAAWLQQPHASVARSGEPAGQRPHRDLGDDGGHLLGPLQAATAACSQGCAAPEEMDNTVYVGCSLAGRTVEMLVDTGAQVSVISAPLAKQLDLLKFLDGSQQGVAAGVGSVSILGILRGVPAMLGGMPLVLDLPVLDISEAMLVLGLDQLERLGCVVDLEQRLLILKRPSCTVVPFLPPNPGRRGQQEACCVM